MATVVVNGERHEVAADPDTMLLYVLRNDLGLAGTRFGCGLGLCGACTVLIDGYPTHSCQTPLWSIDGKSVTTVEGLGQAEQLHPVQQAVIEEQAGQCGYCLSGIIVRAAALLAENPKPSPDDVRAALDGNLCRCGIHNRVVRAVLRASGSTP